MSVRIAPREWLFSTAIRLLSTTVSSRPPALQRLRTIDEREAKDVGESFDFLQCSRRGIAIGKVRTLLLLSVFLNVELGVQ